MKKILAVTLLASAAFTTTGCAPRIGGNDYAITGAGEVNTTYRGTIVAMRPVNISASRTEQDNQPGTGAAIGAVSGAVLGSQIGKGHGSAIAGLAGALAGGVAGHYAGQALTDQQGFEYQVQQDNGALVTIAQGAEPKLHVGQRVLVVSSQKSRGRIIPDATGY